MYRPKTPDIWAWCIVSAAVAFATDLVCQFGVLSLEDAVKGVLDTSAFTVAAWILVLLRATSVVVERPASMLEVALAVTAAALCAVPAPEAINLVAAGLAVALLVRSDVTSNGRQAGVLLALLAVEQAWQSPYLHPLHVAVAHIDAQTVGWISRHLGNAVAADGKLVGTDAFKVDILIWCASSMPLAHVAVGFAVVVVWFRGALIRADVPWLAASLAASVLLTQVRLSLLVVNQASYEWWHNGPGYAIYQFTALGFALLIPLLCCTVPFGRVHVGGQSELAS